MRKPAEITVFFGVAVAVHVVLFALVPREGVEAGGVGGEYLISVQAADATIRELVETWERPPEVVEDQTELDAPDEAALDVNLPVIKPVVAPRAEIQLAMAAPERDRPEKMETETVAPPPPPEPEKPEAEAELEPEAEAKAEVVEKPRRRPENLEPIEEPAKTADVDSARQVEQKSAGAGGSAVAGNRGNASTTTLSRGETVRLTTVWGSQIRARIERRKRRPSGRPERVSVEIFVIVQTSGQLANVGIERSSGIAEFDHAAVRAVKRAGRFDRAPKGLDKPQYRFTLRMDFG